MSGFFSELKRRNVIRVAIFYAVGSWLVLQVADVLFGLIGVPDWSLRLVGGILLLGFPFALILAWAFELTPEGLRREKDVDRTRPADPEAGRKLDIATIGLLVVALGLLAWDHFTRAPGDVAPAAAPATGPAEDSPRDLSIAVLPFVNMSGDPENEYFSDGLSEEVLNVLARIEDFRVAGRTSSFAFKGQNQDLRAIGEKLSVVHILEGSVRRQGNRVRVTAQLIDARNGYHLWSENYDRQLDDVFAIQDEIATEVVKALKTRLLEEDEEVIAGGARGDVEAYNHYLKGQFHARLRTPEGLERALEEFQKAILVDPDYAPPYAGIGMIYALMENYGYRPLVETRELAEKAVQRAIELSPDSDEAWAAKGLLHTQMAGQTGTAATPEAADALDRAIRINPNNALAHLWRASTRFPDWQAMAADIDRAYELDPLHPVIIRRKLMISMPTSGPEVADRWLAELRSVAPDWYLTWVSVAEIARDRGRIAESALAMERVLELNPDFLTGRMMLAQDLEMLGYADRARDLLAEAALRFPREQVAEPIAALDARAALSGGDFQGAAEIYGRALGVMKAPNANQVANLALLEVGAGRPGAAEERMRAELGYEGKVDPSRMNFDTMTAWYALATALVAQGQAEAAGPIGAAVNRVLDAVSSSGATFSYFPFARGLVANLAGRTEVLEPSVREAIEAGFRINPADLVWFLPLHWESPEARRAADMVAEVLAGERARYEAAKAAGGATT